jgi:hypothetical protein
VESPPKGTFTATRRDKRERWIIVPLRKIIMKNDIIYYLQIGKAEVKASSPSFFLFYFLPHRPSPLYSRTKKGEDPGSMDPSGESQSSHTWDRV